MHVATNEELMSDERDSALKSEFKRLKDQSTVKKIDVNLADPSSPSIVAQEMTDSYLDSSAVLNVPTH